MPRLGVEWGFDAVALGDASHGAAALQIHRTGVRRVLGAVFLPSFMTWGDLQGAGCQDRVLSCSSASHQAAAPKGPE